MSIAKLNQTNEYQKLSILKLFNKAVKENQECSDNDLAEVLKYGIISSKFVDVNTLLVYIKQKKFNPNATFYKTFLDITNKSRYELFLDQIVHYYSTYGTNFTAQPFVVNGSTVDISKTIFIETITLSQAIVRCQNMLYSGIALSQETIESILVIIEDDFEISRIKNKEALCIICSKKNLFPENPEDLLRFLVYKAIGKSLLIKDKKTLALISVANHNNSIIPIEHVDKLSVVFHRFKDIFLSFKSNPNNKHTVNRIRKLAKLNHKPFIHSFWSNVVSIKKDLIEVEKKAADLNNFKKITLLNTIMKLLHNDIGIDTYIIRNGKLWVNVDSSAKRSSIQYFSEVIQIWKNNSFSKEDKKSYLQSVYDILYKTLINDITKNKTEIILPEKLVIMAPTSEKSFMGEIPIYSYISLVKDAIIGINWRSENGADDLDLSMNRLDGSKIGWNSDFYSKSKTFIYSGDMTSAKPEATELLYRKYESDVDGIVKVNPYSADEDSQFSVFFACQEINNMERNYMVNPDNIIYQYSDTISEEKIIGLFTDNKFIFCNLKLQNRQVSAKSITDLQLIYLKHNHKHYLTLEKILTDAGFKITKYKNCIMSKDTVLKCLC